MSEKSLILCKLSYIRWQILSVSIHAHQQIRIWIVKGTFDVLNCWIYRKNNFRNSHSVKKWLFKA